jgi:hypothetical protein
MTCKVQMYFQKLQRPKKLLGQTNVILCNVQILRRDFFSTYQAYNLAGKYRLWLSAFKDQSLFIYLSLVYLTVPLIANILKV